MTRAKQYTLHEVNEIIIASERRFSPKSGEMGHTLTYHSEVSHPELRKIVRGGLQSVPGFPVIASETGIVDKDAHFDAWQSANPGLSKNKCRKAYATMIDNGKKQNGAFMDRQETIRVVHHILNSDGGQALLKKLDDGSKREQGVFDTGAMRKHRKNSGKMLFCENDDYAQPYLTDFTQAFILLDRIEAGGIHLHTCYPKH